MFATLELSLKAQPSKEWPQATLLPSPSGALSFSLPRAHCSCLSLGVDSGVGEPESSLTRTDACAGPPDSVGPGTSTPASWWL